MSMLKRGFSNIDPRINEVVKTFTIGDVTAWWQRKLDLWYNRKKIIGNNSCLKKNSAKNVKQDITDVID